MKILLVNNNQVVQKLIDVTTRKVDCELTTLISFQEFESESDVKKYDLVVFDQEILEGYKGNFAFLDGLKSIILYSQASQDDALFSHFTYTIKKPFLPNEFLSFLVSAKQSLKEKQKEEFANLDEKEMFANIDAEDEGGENDDDLNQLLKDLNISTEDSTSLDNSGEDDLDALLQDLPEEDELKEENKEEKEEQQEEQKQQEELHEQKPEGEAELEEIEDDKEQEQDLEELDEIKENDVKAQNEDSKKIEVVEVETPTNPQVSEVAEMPEEVSSESKEQESKEDEHDELSKILDESDEEIRELEEENHSAGGALDLAEIAKVQNLLQEVQKSGGKVGGETFGELDLLQNLLSSRSPEGIREILDGMQLTINISFPKKEH